MINEDVWYELDTAAKLYPAILSPKQASVFRVCCTLTEPVDPEILQTALYVTIQRYPSFNVRLKRGVFWFYFEANTNLPVVSEETVYPCQMIDPAQNDNFMFRVTWFGHRINLEIFHVIADGTGGIEFLKTLVYYYLNLQGKSVRPDGMIRTLETKVDDEELENSFQRYYDPLFSTSRAEEKAYHFSGNKLPSQHVRLIHGLIPVEELLNKVHSYHVTVTAYLTAVLIKAFFAAEKNPKKSDEIVKISVPINLRALFPSITVRNFSFYMNIGERFSRKNISFESLLSTVSGQIQDQIQRDKVLSRMNPNVSFEKNAVIRVVPLDVKQAVIKQVHRIVGDDLFTCSFSNLGVVCLPESMEPFISRFDFCLSISDRIPLNCSMCTSNGIVSITFTSSLKETSVEQEFFRFLSDEGLNVTIESSEG
ncbi:MAG: hypothetical protein AB9907_12360 [Flexilinea sp.]